MITDFYNKLSKQEKTILYVATIIVLVAFFDRLVMQNILRKVTSIEEEIHAKEIALKNGVKLISQKDWIDYEERLYSSYGLSGKSQEEELSDILKEIERLATESSVNLFEIKPSDLKAEKVIKKYALYINCEATMPQLANFIYQIESSKMLFSVDNYSLTVKDKEKGILRCAMNLSRIVVLE